MKHDVPKIFSLFYSFYLSHIMILYCMILARGYFYLDHIQSSHLNFSWPGFYLSPGKVVFLTKYLSKDFHKLQLIF